MIWNWAGLIKQKKAVSLFFAGWNDVDVYIEDKEFSTQKVYIELFRRITNGKLKISRVFPLGSKENVINACQESSAQNSKRTSLYIVDGDLGLILSEPNPKFDNLYIHDCYCIENYLVDELAAVEIMHEEDAVKSREEIRLKLNYNDSFAREVNILLELFIVFALLRKYKPEEKTVSYGLSHFTTGGKNPTLDVVAINKFINEMHKTLSDIQGYENIVNEKIEIYEHVGDSVEEGFKYVSGKDFLFLLLARHMRNIVSIKASRDSFKVRMAKACNLDKLYPLQDYIHRLIPLS